MHLFINTDRFGLSVTFLKNSVATSNEVSSSVDNIEYVLAPADNIADIPFLSEKNSIAASIPPVIGVKIDS